MASSLLTATYLSQLDQYKSLVVGFSGGLDSTVLLHNLASQAHLADKLIAVHVNHGLSTNALAWQQHCQAVCEDLGLKLLIKPVEFERAANIEEGARRARYKIFESLIEADSCLLLAHHLDDQAETLLLQLFRGAGIDGLAAMAADKQFGKGHLLRPLLGYSRQNLEAYAQSYQLSWIEDESNQDVSFSRNYLRHEVIPTLRTRWPGVVSNLVRTTHHCQQAQANLEDLAKLDCPDMLTIRSSLTLAPLMLLSPARRNNVLRFWFKSHKVRLPNTLTFNRLIKEVIHAEEDAKPEISWDGICLRRYQGDLYLLRGSPQEALPPSIPWPSFPEPLKLKGLGTLQLKKVAKGFSYPPQGTIEIRFRQGGESFYWHGQTKQLKKLFQEWQIPPWLRERVPLLYINQHLAVVVGYAVSDLFYQEQGGDTYQIELSP